MFSTHNTALDTLPLSIHYGCLESVEWNGGMEQWNGTVEWNSGMEYWNGSKIFLKPLPWNRCTTNGGMPEHWNDPICVLYIDIHFAT